MTEAEVREDRPLDETRPEVTELEELPQEHGRRDPRALEAAISGEVPSAAPGAAGESAPGEPSRAEIFAQAPELAGESGASSPGTPTRQLNAEQAGADVPRPTPASGAGGQGAVHPQPQSEEEDG
jgi:hypothetical protein